MRTLIIIVIVLLVLIGIVLGVKYYASGNDDRLRACESENECIIISDKDCNRFCYNSDSGKKDERDNCTYPNEAYCECNNNKCILVYQDIIAETSCLNLGCKIGTKYVGSINSDKYYACDCRYAKNIKPENLICFESDEEAVEKGYIKTEC